jgi:hypothetical protein
MRARLDRLLRRLCPFNRGGDGAADHAFARHGGKTYSKPEVDRALALTVEFFTQHLGGEYR